MALDVRGKTVVLTGTFSKIKRADAEARLAALGAKIGSGVGKTTHVLFAGEKAGSKINAANKLGVTVLGEDELMALLSGGVAAAAAVGFDAAALDAAAAGPKLAAAIEALPWDAFEVDRDLPGLREVLYAHEAAHGAVTDAHRAATARLRPQAVLRHGHGHDVEVGWTDLSPDGRFLATGSWVGSDYNLGGVLQIWDVRAGRCVNVLRIHGGVGWPDYGGCIQWRPDGRRVGLAFDTNGVGSFDPFGRTGEPDSCAYITDGWSRPPGWTWAPNSRDVYIACWGPDLALGAIVPLVGRRPEPRWCAAVERVDPKDPDSEPRMQPPRHVTWVHPERIIGRSSESLYAIDVKTGKIAWEQVAAPPVSFSPDGEEFAMHPAGIVYYDTRTGLPNGKMPMHVGAESLHYSRDGARLAAVVQPENRWGAEAGVFIYDRGEYRYSPDATRPNVRETLHAAWSPDGRKLAVTIGKRLQIWELADTAVLRLEVPSPAASGVAYGDGVLIAWSSFGLAFHRETDGALIGAFKPAVEASGESPLADDQEDLGEHWAWDPAFPLDMVRVAAALPEGVVIGPEEGASLEEIDMKIAWVIDRKWAWPWRWGEAKVWPDAAAACKDPAAPAILKKKFGKRTKPAARAKAGAWPPAGGSLDDIAGLLASGIRGIGDTYHGGDYRRKYATRTMALGMFDRAAAALDASDGWAAWTDPWFSAYAHAEVVVTALAGRIAGAPALTAEQTASLRGWLTTAEGLLKKKAAKTQPQCRPLAMLGAGWILLGEKKRGETALAEAIRTIDPENNSTEHRRVVAEALAAVGRVREASTHLTSAPGRPSWTETPIAFVAIVPRASVAELDDLHARLKAVEGHNEFVLLGRGLARLIELGEWDAAQAWLDRFEGLSTSEARLQLLVGMLAAGEVERAEALIVAPDSDRLELLLELARHEPARARAHLDRLLQAPSRLAKGSLATLAVRVGRLDLATGIEALAREGSERHEVRLAVLAELDPTDLTWSMWFTRARAQAPGGPHDAVDLAALAHRGGLREASAELLDQAIEAARGASSADLALEEVSGRMATAGDFAGAHRAWQAIAKGMRSYRNGRLLDACVQRGLWAATLDLLRQMPMDLNGAPQRASQVLLKAAGGEGW